MQARRLFVATVVLLPVLFLGCGAQHTTEEGMIAWSQALNAHLGTSQNHSYPDTLDDVDPMLRGAVSMTDGWGNPYTYRLILDTQYWLISPGADGTIGNEDDVIMENAKLREPGQFWAKNKVPE